LGFTAAAALGCVPCAAVATVLGAVALVTGATAAAAEYYEGNTGWALFDSAVTALGAYGAVAKLVDETAQLALDINRLKGAMRIAMTADDIRALHLKFDAWERS
jgi:hypothetical protein